MAYCTHCGNELKEGARFCEACGYEVQTHAPVPVRQNRPIERVGNTPEQEEQAKSALIWSIVGAALSELGLPGWIVSAVAKGKVKRAMRAGTTGGKLKAARIVSNVGLGISIAMTIFWALYICLIVGIVVFAAQNGTNVFDRMMWY